MYTTAESLPVESLGSGTYLLAGPAMSGKYDILIGLLVEGLSNGEAAMFVTTNQDAEAVYTDLMDRAGSPPGRVRMVDCVSEQQAAESALSPDRVEYVSSPADLTGIGIGVSEQLRRFADEGVQRTRLGFYSLSTLLMYAELETVFRFLHVVSGRVESIGGFSVFTLDPTTHDEGTINTLKQLFDGMIELRSNGDDKEVRLVGIPNRSEEWVSRV